MNHPFTKGQFIKAMLELVMKYRLSHVNFTANIKKSSRYPYNEHVEIKFSDNVTGHILSTLVEYFCVEILDGSIYLTGVMHSSFMLKALDITLKK